MRLIVKTRAEALAAIENMALAERVQLSSVWLEILTRSAAIDPWIHGFSVTLIDSGNAIGHCGFKGPPTAEGVVEIAYGIDETHRGRGFATEAAQALYDYAAQHAAVHSVIAHTLPEPNASTRVLTKCGFKHLGEVIDPEDGLVWRWERRVNA